MKTFSLLACLTLLGCPAEAPPPAADPAPTLNGLAAVTDPGPWSDLWREPGLPTSVRWRLRTLDAWRRSATFHDQAVETA